MDWHYLFLLAASLSFMLLQAVQPSKHTKHYLFAIFCGSMAMMSLQNLSAESLGAYQYLIGLGACATCNVVWLISRSLFRLKDAIKIEHIVVAIAIAILVMLNKTNALFVGLDIHAPFLNASKEGLNEILNLLSSTVLALTFWESIRQFSNRTSALKKQGLIFAGTFLTALFSCMLVPTILPDEALIQKVYPYLVVSSAFAIMLAIQVILWIQTRSDNQQLRNKDHTHILGNPREEKPTFDLNTAVAIEKLIVEEHIYLQANLRMKDIAQAIDVPEYKVSRIIRHHFNAQNFNTFINYYRIEHAKALISSEKGKAWSLLVISLESGFSSLVTFNRAFKATVGLLPSEYKERHLGLKL